MVARSCGSLAPRLKAFRALLLSIAPMAIWGYTLLLKRGVELKKAFYI